MSSNLTKLYFSNFYVFCDLIYVVKSGTIHFGTIVIFVCECFVEDFRLLAVISAHILQALYRDQYQIILIISTKLIILVLTINNLLIRGALLVLGNLFFYEQLQIGVQIIVKHGNGIVTHKIRRFSTRPYKLALFNF